MQRQVAKSQRAAADFITRSRQNHDAGRRSNTNFGILRRRKAAERRLEGLR